MKLITGLLIITSLCFGTTAMATNFYVNPNGNDLWSGTLKIQNEKKSDGPFKTIERAKQAIRTLKQTNTFDDKVTVNIATGFYTLNQPLNFNIMDSGLIGREILWQGEPGAQVTVSAGLPITCEKRNAQIWDCPLTKLPVNTAYSDWRMKELGNTLRFQLFVNDQKLELARWPDEGWAHIKTPIENKTQFSVMETLPTLIGDIKSAQVHIFPGNDWFDQIIGIDTINPSANIINLTTPTSYELASGRRFYIQNLPSLLNAPGEWLYDAADKKVSFILPEGITPKTAVLTSLTNILIADGVSYLTFKNLSFQYSAGTAIVVKNATHVVMDQIDINNIGGKGVEIKDGQNVLLSNSKIHHTGSMGVDVSGGDRKSLQPSGHVIHNNHIHHNGTALLTKSPGIGLSGVGGKVTHNLLEQGSEMGISVSGNDHLIEKNEVHHFCLQTSDCGAVYTGRDWSARGNVIRHNYIHDIIGYGMKSVDVPNNHVVYESPGYAIGVYLDDGASGFDISGNIFENVGAVSLHIHGGRDNKIENNYFKTNGFAIWVVQQAQAHVLEQNKKNLEVSPYKTKLWQQRYPKLATPIIHADWPEGNTIERNIFVTTKPDGYSLRYFVPTNSTTIANNLIWSTSGKLAVDYNIIDSNNKAHGVPWSQWIDQKIEHGSIVADPCVSIVNSKMITCPGSSIKAIGFQPLPTDIGLIP